MQRELSDAEGTRWTCVQAFSGLGDGGGQGDRDGERAGSTGGDAPSAAASAAAALAARRAGGSPGTVAVVCTPAGGQQSVRLALPRDWADAIDDAALAAAIGQARGDG